MKEIPISEFKATCLTVLEEVRRTGEPIRVTRHGRAIAEIIPSTGAPERTGTRLSPARLTSDGKFRLGGMEGKLKITGDLIAPIVPPEAWEVLRDEAPPGPAQKKLKRNRVRPRARKGKRGSRKRP